MGQWPRDIVTDYGGASLIHLLSSFWLAVSPNITMVPNPDWVKQLRPSGPQGHELLDAERAKSDIPVKKLQELLLTKDTIERRNRILDILKSEPVFDKSSNYFNGRVERFERALAREKKLQLLRRKHNWDIDELRTASEAVGEPGPYALHESMFKV
jgi:acyl-CoA oxidase